MKENRQQLNALQIISIQHELGMAIGNQIELSEMLEFFIKVCIQRLGLIGAHVYLYNGKNGWPETRDYVRAGFDLPAHYLSIPQQSNAAGWAQHDLLEQFSNADLCREQHDKKIEGSHFHTFPIPQHGVLVLQAHANLDATICKALRPIFNRLANSCRASISHEGLVREIQARKEAERNLQHQVFHNSVTDLPNLKWLTQAIEQEKLKPSVDSLKKSLLCIEVENYHRITNTLGYETGDKIQQRFAKILCNLTRERDLVCQIDSNVFMIVLDQGSQQSSDLEATSQLLANRIQSSVAEPLVVRSHPVLLSIRSGFEVYPVFCCDSEQVIKHAEIAKSDSVTNSCDSATLYSKEIQDRVDNRIRMEQALKSAAKNAELALWWQPQYSSSQRLIGAEALLRWVSPEWGFVSPGVFVPIAEETDLIEKIGDWVLETACQQLAEICDLGLPPHFKKLAINVSARQLVQATFVDRLIKLIQKYKLPRGLLAIELTESTLVQNFEQTVALIQRLKEAGVDCSLDDFGTG
ncbi:MAG: EAL domain-containing protein, partial [Granulosicoccaceae bacterium]